MVKNNQNKRFSNLQAPMTPIGEVNFRLSTNPTPSNKKSFLN
jgi:hypothetical protein